MSKIGLILWQYNSANFYFGSIKSTTTENWIFIQYKVESRKIENSEMMIIFSLNIFNIKLSISASQSVGENIF